MQNFSLNFTVREIQKILMGKSLYKQL